MKNLWHVLGFGLVKIGIWSSILRIWEVISSAAKILTGSAVVIYRARETIFHVKNHVCARAMCMAVVFFDVLFFVDMKTQI